MFIYILLISKEFHNHTGLVLFMAMQALLERTCFWENIWKSFLILLFQGRQGRGFQGWPHMREVSASSICFQSLIKLNHKREPPGCSGPILDYILNFEDILPRNIFSEECWMLEAIQTFTEREAILLKMIKRRCTIVYCISLSNLA